MHETLSEMVYVSLLMNARDRELCGSNQRTHSQLTSMKEHFISLHGPRQNENVGDP